MEAMASGCPPVATDVTGVRELITEPSLGSVVPVGDPAQLAAAVIGLSDPTRRAAMSGRARQAVLTNFTIEASMRKTLSVIEDAVAAHG
jgi:mannosyltransferase